MADDEFPNWRLERIASAVETVEESLSILSDTQAVTFEQYQNESRIRDVVERRFVKLTEASLDIARMILGFEVDSVPERNPQIIRELGNADILSAEVTEEMVEAVRFRNVLAHTYGHDIDDKLVYDALQDLDRYRMYIREVHEYLESATA